MTWLLMGAAAMVALLAVLTLAGQLGAAIRGCLGGGLRGCAALVLLAMAAGLVLAALRMGAGG